MQRQPTPARRALRTPWAGSPCDCHPIALAESIVLHRELIPKFLAIPTVGPLSAGQRAAQTLMTRNFTAQNLIARQGILAGDRDNVIRVY